MNRIRRITLHLPARLTKDANTIARNVGHDLGQLALDGQVKSGQGPIWVSTAGVPSQAVPNRVRAGMASGREKP